MKETTFVGLVVAVLYFTQRVTAGGTLSFVTLNSLTTLRRIDDTISPPISIDEGFLFGTGTVYTVYVSENGYISMGGTPCSGSLSASRSCSVVAPYGADINTQIAGSVRYTTFDTYSSGDSSITGVSSFIRDETGDDFYGTRMMVAEWNGVSRFNGVSFITNTFQGILITDGRNSYAVFIYECGGMEWGGGEIGWRDGSSEQVSHPLSGSSNSNDIGCLYSNTYSAIAYRLRSACDFDEFTCDNGECIPQNSVCDRSIGCGDNSDEVGCGCFSYEFICDNGQCTYEGDKCDGFNDCGDNSDEDGCESSDVNVGLAVGLSVGLVFLILVIGVPLCIVLGVCCLSKKSKRPVQTRIVATAPMAGATTIVTSSQAGTSTTVPVQYPQQPAYEDSQLSGPSAPPLYPGAAVFPQAAQGYNQYQPISAAAYPQQQNTSYPLQNQVYPQALPYSNQPYSPPNLPA